MREPDETAIIAEELLNMTLTQGLILATSVIWIAYDIWIYKNKGNSATESATLYDWNFYAPGIGCLIGILMGHLFFPQHDEPMRVLQSELLKCKSQVTKEVN